MNMDKAHHALCGSNNENSNPSLDHQQQQSANNASVQSEEACTLGKKGQSAAVPLLVCTSTRVLFEPPT